MLDERAAGRDLDVLERGEVEEGVRTAVLALERVAVRIVRDRGTVHLVDDVAGALGDEVGAPGNAALIAGDVDGVDLDSRHLLDQRPDVASRRDLGQLVLREILAGLDLPRVDQGGRARHGHRFLHRGQLQLHVHLRVLADRDGHVLPRDSRESRHRHGHRVLAGRHFQEPEEAVRVHAGRDRRGRSDERSRTSGDHFSLFVDYVSVNVACVGLGNERRREEQRPGDCKKDSAKRPRHCDLLQMMKTGSKLLEVMLSRFRRVKSIPITGKTACARFESAEAGFVILKRVTWSHRGAKS